MKQKEFEKLIRQYLLPWLPSYGVRGGLLFLSPLKLVLRGFAFSSSQWNKSRFVVCAFVQPLYVPKEVIVLTLGKRLGTIHGGPEKWWEINNGNEKSVMEEVREQIKEGGEGLIEPFDGPYAVASGITKLCTSPRNVTIAEVVAYSLVLSDQTRAATRALEELESDLKLRISNGAPPWMGTILTRVQEVQRALSTEPRAAQRLLDSWSDKTAEALGLRRESQKAVNG